MKKRWLWLWIAAFAFLLAAGAAALLVSFWLAREESGWSTSSKEAAEELDTGIGDLERYYWSDASRHFERALDLDPEFAVAKLYLDFVQHRDSDEFKRLLAELHQVDLATLRPRERLMIRLWLTFNDDGREAAKAVLGEFLAAFPDDLFALRFDCQLAWEEEHWGEAEACYRRLAKVHPNWSEAYERLGSLAMAQGHFSAAEENLRTYRYLAPEEASPHVSLAQLLILLGRYEEAGTELAEAIRLKPDFCQAHFQELRLLLFTGRTSEVGAVVDRLAALDGCSWLAEHGWLCQSRCFADFLAGDLEAAWTDMEGDCLARRGGYDLLGYRVAVATGREAEAAAMETVLDQRIAAMEKAGQLPIATDGLRAARAHGEGLRLLAAGHAREAVERLREADTKLRYWGYETIGFKFVNWRTLVYALQLAGQEEAARVEVERISEVNPRLVEEFVLPDMERLLAARSSSGP